MENKPQAAIEIIEIQDEKYGLVGYVPLINFPGRTVEIHKTRVAVSNSFDMVELPSYMEKASQLCYETEEALKRGDITRDEVVQGLIKRIEDLVPETSGEIK